MWWLKEQALKTDLVSTPDFPLIPTVEKSKDGEVK